MSDNNTVEQANDFARAIADTFITAEEAAQNMRRQLQALPTLEDVIASWNPTFEAPEEAPGD